MRDISRIDVFCDRLKEAWKCQPDLRFGQIVCNAQRAKGNDLFYLEDDRCIKFIEDMLKNGNKYVFWE